MKRRCIVFASIVLASLAGETHFSGQEEHVPNLPRPVANSIDPILVDRYAPQLMHPSDEPNLPTNVDAFLPEATLEFHNRSCSLDNKTFGKASFDLLENATVSSTCSAHVFRASGTRSADRSNTFVLSDVPDAVKKGSRDPEQWTTYYHAYRNSSGGWTIQYWSFYAFNTGTKIGPLEFGYHGGDWEMVAVVLGLDDQPLMLRVTGHKNLESTPWSGVTKNQTHAIVYTEKGGHEAHPVPRGHGLYIVHPTWTGSVASIPNDPPRLVGPLVDLGSKLNPKVRFLRYSGIWGSLGITQISSGYWGPAFNETGMTNGFLAAWCDGMENPALTAQGSRECYPDDPQ